MSDSSVFLPFLDSPALAAPVSPSPTSILPEDDNASLVQPYSQQHISSILSQVNSPSQYDNWINEAAQAFDEDPRMLKAQLIAESGLNPNASSGEASGIAQFTPATAASMGVDMSSPKDQIFGAAQLLAMHGGQTATGFGSYYGGNSQGKNTKQYVDNMLSLQKALKDNNKATTAQTPEQALADFVKGAPIDDKRMDAVNAKVKSQDAAINNPLNVIKGIGQSLSQDVGVVGSEVKNYFNNFSKLHATHSVSITQQDINTAKQMGLSGNSLPNFGMPNTTIQVLNVTPAQFTQSYNKALASSGHTLSDIQKNNQSGQGGTGGDLLLSIEQNSMAANVIKNAANPSLATTKLYTDIKTFEAAQKVLQNPSKYNNKQKLTAATTIAILKGQDPSFLSQVKQTLSHFKSDPYKSMKGLLYSIGEDPELLFAGGVDGIPGLAGKIKDATKAAEDAIRSGDYASALKATKGLSTLDKVEKAGRVIAPAATAGGINAAVTQQQEIADQGFSRNKDVESSAAFGVALGALFAGGRVLRGERPPEVNPADNGGASAAGPTEGSPGRPGSPLTPNTPIDNTQTVPYAGGVSEDGSKVFLDRRMPSTVTVNGFNGSPVTINTSDAVGIHERVEYPLMHLDGPMDPQDILSFTNAVKGEESIPASVRAKMRNGIPLTYQEAHNIATSIENNYVRYHYNVDPRKYQNSLKDAIKQADAAGKREGTANVPPDIDKKPYVDSKQAGRVDKDTLKKITIGAGALAAGATYIESQKDKEKAFGQVVSPAILVGLGRFGDDALSDRVDSMIRDGASDRYIYKNTGVWKMPDGSLVKPVSTIRDIPDIVKNVSDPNGYKVSPDGDHIFKPLSEVMRGTVFDKHYPDIVRESNVVLDPDLESGTGYTHGKDIHISLEDVKNPQELGATVSHEFQHLIQNKSGMAQGSSPAIEARRYPSENATSSYLRQTGEMGARMSEEHNLIPQETLNGIYPEDMPDWHATVSRYGPPKVGYVGGAARSLSVKSNEDLVKDILAGDSKALAVLSGRVLPSLTRFVRGLDARFGSDSRAEPDDVAQETMIKALQTLPTFEGRSSFSTWLNKIAVNTRLDMIRSAGRKYKWTNMSVPKSDIHFNGEEWIPDLGTSPNTPDVETLPGHNKLLRPDELEDARQATAKINDTIDKLSDKQKTVLGAYLHDVNPEDIGMSKTEFSSAVQHIKKVLHEKLKGRVNNFDYHNQGGSIDPALLKRMAKWSLLIGAAATGESYFKDKDWGWFYGMLAASAIMRFRPGSIPSFVRDLTSAPHGNVGIDIVRAGSTTLERWKRLTTSAVYKARALHVPKSEREQITFARQKGSKVGLNERQKKLYDLADSYYEEAGRMGMEQDLLHDLVDHYANHAWVNNDKLNAYKQEYEREYANASDKTKHDLRKKYTSYADGIAHGLTPVTTDALYLMQMYGDSMGRVAFAKTIIDGLKNRIFDPAHGVHLMQPIGGRTKTVRVTRMVNGVPTRVSKKITVEDEPPSNWATIDHPLFRGYKVHPDLAPSLRQIFTVRSNSAFLQTLDALNYGVKGIDTSYSFFHPTSMFIAGIPTVPVKDAPRYMWEAMKAMAGKSHANIDYVTGTNGDAIDMLLRGGLTADTMSLPADPDVHVNLERGFQTVERWVQGLGFPATTTVRMASAINSGVNRIVWENAHLGINLTIALKNLARMKANWAKVADADPSAHIPSDEEIAREATAFSGAFVGGTDWRRFAEEATTRVGKALMTALTNPVTRNVMQIMLFSPDWDMSAWIAALKSFDVSRTAADIRNAPDALSKIKTAAKSPLKGTEGILHPKNRVDLFRGTWLRSIVYYMTVLNAINYAMSGHFIWQNKDPLMLDGKNGIKYDVAKHATEFVRFASGAFEHPRNGVGRGENTIRSMSKYILGKLNFVPSELADQLQNIEYPNANGDPIPMREGRVSHLLSRSLPFQAETAKRGATPFQTGMSMFFGVYGNRETDAQKASRRKIGARKAAAKRRERDGGDF